MTTTRPARFISGAILLVATLCAPVAHAQMSLSRPPSEQETVIEESVKPPRIETPGKANTIVAVLVTAVTALLCVGIVVLPGRRSYED